MIVLSRPIFVEPPSSIIDKFLSFLKYSKTWSASVGLSELEVLALGAAIGLPKDLINFNAVVLLGILTPIVSKFALANSLILDSFFFFKITVIGPGQKRSLNFLISSFISQFSSTWSKDEKWIIKGLNSGLFLVSKILAIARLFVASPPSP